VKHCVIISLASIYKTLDTCNTVDKNNPRPFNDSTYVTAR